MKKQQTQPTSQTQPTQEPTSQTQPTQEQMDKNELDRLCKVVSPTSNDMNSIYVLYRKYVVPNARMYSTNGCQTCGNSIVVYWRGLMAWYNQHKGDFNKNI